MRAAIRWVECWAVDAEKQTSSTRIERKKRGGARPGAGRKPGIPNKSTTAAREAIARFVDANAGRLQGWLDEVAEKDGPLVAFQCVERVLEYHVPKLQRSELTGADGKDLTIAWPVAPPKLEDR